MAAIARAQWDFDPSQEANIDSFRVKTGPSSGNYTQNIGVAKNLRIVDLTGTNGQVFYVVVVALSGGVESAPSNEITVTTSIPAPTNLQEIPV